MAAVHSSCRLCIHLATKIQEIEEKSAAFQNRSCSCASNMGTVYHLFVRERGRFKMESIYLRYHIFNLLFEFIVSFLSYDSAGLSSMQILRLLHVWNQIWLWLNNLNSLNMHIMIQVLWLNDYFLFLCLDNLWQIWEVDFKSFRICNSSQVQIIEPHTHLEERKANNSKRGKWLENTSNIPSWHHSERSTVHLQI